MCAELVTPRRAGALVLGAALAGATGVCLYLLLRQEREEEVSSLASSRQTVLEVRVPLDSVSYVIGRQGANIKEVQAKTDTRINFRDEVAGELYRVCLVRGSPADCQMAEILIQQMLARQARPEVVELAVPTRAVGRIIGRAGETVRSIQRLSGAKVDVERADSGEERRVTLRGTREDIETAQKMIEEKVKEEELTRLSVTSRPPRIKYKQPLFLNYDQVRLTIDQTTTADMQECICCRTVMRRLWGERGSGRRNSWSRAPRTTAWRCWYLPSPARVSAPVCRDPGSRVVPAERGLAVRAA